MKNLKLSNDLQAEVRDYINSTANTLDQQEELEEFLKLISPSLKLKVSKELFSEVIR